MMRASCLTAVAAFLVTAESEPLEISHQVEEVTEDGSRRTFDVHSLICGAGQDCSTYRIDKGDHWHSCKGFSGQHIWSSNPHIYDIANWHYEQVKKDGSLRLEKHNIFSWYKVHYQWGSRRHHQAAACKSCVWEAWYQYRQFGPSEGKRCFTCHWSSQNNFDMFVMKGGWSLTNPGADDFTQCAEGGIGRRSQTFEEARAEAEREMEEDGSRGFVKGFGPNGEVQTWGGQDVGNNAPMIHLTTPGLPTPMPTPNCLPGEVGCYREVAGEASGFMGAHGTTVVVSLAFVAAIVTGGLIACRRKPLLETETEILA